MKVLITGGSGFVGSRLTEMLSEKGHEVAHLGRTKREGAVATYTWDITKGTIEDGTLEGVDSLVHLAGAGVADSRWTKKRKREIIESRTKSTELLCKTLEETDHQVQCMVAASAVGYYGWDTGDSWCIEGSNLGSGFLAEVVDQWEKETSAFRDLNIKTAQLRIGVVLDQGGGALGKMVDPIKMGIGSPLASGKQWMSWIHIDDLCSMIIYSIENQFDGVYNAVGPEPVTNAQLTQAIAKVLGKPLFMPNVPGFVLKLLLGEMATMVIGGNRVSPQKMIEAGFRFTYGKIDAALSSIFAEDP